MAETSANVLPQNTDVKILDGGLGSELERLGYHIDDYALWSARWLINDPSAIWKAHTNFLESGADIIETASYQASIHNLVEAVGLTVEKAKQIIRSSVVIAKQARNDFWNLKNSPQNADNASLSDRAMPEIAGSVGPYGACLHDGSEYTGEYVTNISIEELMDWHRPRLRCLTQEGVDYFAFETIPASKEGLALLNLLREFPNQKAWISFSCKDGSSTSYGDSFASTVKMCQTNAPSNQLVAIGMNCVPPEFVSDLLTDAEGANGDIPFIVYPNSGETWIPGKGWKELEVNKKNVIFTLTPTWLNLGVKYIGGCCRVTPNEIAQIHDIVKQNKITSDE